MGFLIRDTHDGKYAFLHVTAVNTNGTAADFVAVAHNVIRIGQSVTGVGVKSIQAFRFRGGEGVVHCSPGGMPQCHITGCLCVGGRFKQGCIDNPGECPLPFFDQAKALRDLIAGSAQQCAGRFRVTCGEENAITRFRTHVSGNASAFFLSNVLSHRAGQFTVFTDKDVGQTFCAALLSPVLPAIKLTSRLGGTTVHDHGPHVVVLEHAEGRVGKKVCTFHNLDVKTQVGLVGTIEAHGVGVGHAWNRGGNLVSNELPQRHQNFLSQGDHIVLVHKAHFHVQLGEFRLAVGAEILITVAACNLVVAFHACNHEQLLKQLRRLR